VMVALRDLSPGKRVEFAGGSCELTSGIPSKQKFVTEDLASGDAIRMYGVLVGRAKGPIRKGERLTHANIQPDAAPYDGTSPGYRWSPPDISRWANRTFSGYRRVDGQVGTRNYWLVVPLVFCENRNISVLQQAFEEELGYAAPQPYRHQIADLARLHRDGKTPEADALAASGTADAPASNRLFAHLDGIRFLVHQGGCGGTREDSYNLCGLIAGYVNHPNVAGATVLSLGCQHAQIGVLREQLHKRHPKFDKPLIILEQQRSGSEFAMLSEAVRRTFLGLAEADKARREPAALSHLCLGLKCGGSDGFSGISANPSIGHTADLVVALGGKAVLSEFPELCGVEQELINRSSRKEVSDRFVGLVRDYQTRARALSFARDASAGSSRDGFLTEAMHSAAALKKAGTSPVTAVLDYPEYSTQPGLNLQCTPCEDAESVTAQVGAGANIVLFTTGLGTAVGNPIAPVVKLSSNSELARSMPEMIDIDAGQVITGETTVEGMGEAILERVIRIASGEAVTKAEINGQNDFVPWKRGVSL